MKREEFSNITDIIEELKQAKDEVELKYSDNDIAIFNNFKPLSAPENIYVKMNVIACCKKGRMQADIFDETIALEENEIYICSTNQTIRNVMVSPDFECAILCITNNGLRSILGSYMQLWTKTVIVDKINKTELDQQGMAFYDHFYSLLEMCINAEEERYSAWHPFRREIIQQVIKFSLLGLCNNLTLNTHDKLPSKANSDNGFTRFIDLLQNTPMKHQPVDYYADKLFITPKYLTVICKKFSNKTAQEWIREYTLNDISYYLRSTSLPIKEVADKTGFANTSFFGKYVKLYFGVTPKEYRENNQEE